MPEKTMIIQYDGSFDIATGRSRRETNWKNKEILWSELVEKLSTTHRTAETHTEYLTSKKVRQDEIKDIGGFVGGYLTGGRRKANNVMHRQLLTLDLDFATAGVWDDFTMLYGCAACLYSTHKHSPESPRLRLLIPLDRLVRVDEYQAIARRIAGVLNIEVFDPTTFQPERLMYWPSTSKDAEYLFQVQDGEWLSADEVLGSYHDWQDSSAWPVSSKVDKILQRNMLKQGDPLEKPGVIGAFCRTYSLAEAIEVFLPETYEACDVENRYTYKEGSTAAGLVVYDDKYAYSHHGTDPISGKLCNAFDLVRLHKYGLKDEDIREGQKITTYPSFVAMEEFCQKDPKVRKSIGVERIQQAKGDFAQIEYVEAEEVEDDEWLSLLESDKKSNYLSTIDNIYLILKHDQRLKNRLFFNEFEGLLIAKRDLPWRKVTKKSSDFTDDDADCLAHYLEHYKMPFTHLQKALSKIRTDFRTHPIREYLNKQTWDGVSRLDTLLIDYLGAEDSIYTRIATRKSLIACISRVFNPGVKFDTVLTLVGKQGTGKSTILSKLAKEWFSDCLGDIHTKEGMESLRGVWIMEIAEMASFKKADQDAIKRFITSQEDVYRPAYGKQQVRFQRQCVFFGTTNKLDFLSDPTGDRRFLPIATSVIQPVKSIFNDLNSEEINQIWAEALTFYRKGESIDLTDEAKEMAEKIREQHTVVDERTGLIVKYLETLLPENWDSLGIYERRTYLAGDELQADGIITKNIVCVAEIWCEVLGGMQKDMTTNNTKYIHDILRKMYRWIPTKGTRKFSIYGYQRAYEKLTNTDELLANANIVFVKKATTTNSQQTQKK